MRCDFALEFPSDDAEEVGEVDAVAEVDTATFEASTEASTDCPNGRSMRAFEIE